MKLSNKGRYGIRAVFDVAFHGGGHAVQIREVADRQSIPVRFLEQIFHELKRAGLVRAKRGPKGGYRLSGEPDSVRVGDIIRTLEGPIDLAAGTLTGGRPEVMGAAIVDEALRELSSSINDCLDSLTIADLCSREEARRARKLPPRRYVYNI